MESAKITRLEKILIAFIVVQCLELVIDIVLKLRG